MNAATRVENGRQNLQLAKRWRILLLAAPVLLVLVPAAAAGEVVRWERLSSSQGDLPVPGTSRQQTGDVAARFDPDSPATDFVISTRVVGPSLL